MRAGGPPGATTMSQAEVLHGRRGSIKAALTKLSKGAGPLGALLREEGCPPGPIDRAQADAAACDSSFDLALYSDGSVSEASVVSLLAARFGLGEIVGAPPACLHRDHRFAVTRGAIGLADGRLAIVPRDAIIGRLARLAQCDVAARALVLVTRQQMLDMAVATDRDSVADRAAHGLARQFPHFAAETGLARWQIALAIAAIGMLVALIVVSASLSCILCATLSSGFFLALAWLRLGFLNLPVNAAPPRRAASARELPVYTILVALHREDAALAGLIAAIAQLDYPRARLDVKLLIEEDDALTRAALDRLPLPGWIEIITLPKGHPRTKPRALNAGLALARGAFTVVFDAEDRPARRQLRDALDCFAASGPETAVVQARLTIDAAQRGFWPNQFRMEYAGLFGVMLPALAQLGLPVPLGGTSNHFRTDTLRAAGGWDAHNVTEDADLGIRLHRLGYRAATIASETEEEAPTSFSAWLPQRTRWLKGWMLTLLVHLRSPASLVRDCGAVGASVFVITIGGLIASALLEPLCLISFVVALWKDPAYLMARTAAGSILLSLFLTSLVFGHAVAAAVGVAGLWRGGQVARVTTLLLLPLYWLLISLAAWRAVYQLLFDPGRWEKTEHHLARMPIPPGAATRGRSHRSKREVPVDATGTGHNP